MAVDCKLATLLFWIPILFLIEDDDEKWGPEYEEMYANPNPKWKDVADVPRFEVLRARSFEGAMRILSEFKSSGKRLDVVHLDLKLPSLDADVGNKEKTFLGIGRELMKHLTPDVCSAVVIVSDFKEFDIAREALSSDVVADYIPKMKVLSHFEEVYHTMVKAHRSVRQHLEIQWLSLCRERDHRWHFAQTFAQLVDRMALAVSSSMSSLQGNLGELRDFLNSRYRIDPFRDRDDPINRCIKAMEGDTLSIAQRCGQFRSEISSLSDDAQTLVDIKQMLLNIRARLRAGFDFYRVGFVTEFGQDTTEVYTFSTELEQILEELIFSALESTAAISTGQNRNIRVSILTHVAKDLQGKDRRVLNEVQIEDHGEAMPPHMAERLTHGDFFDFHSGRLWGLSLAQRLTHGLGGHLQATPTCHGNVVTIQLPGARHG